jgi:hypothetical protein
MEFMASATRMRGGKEREKRTLQHSKGREEKTASSDSARDVSNGRKRMRTKADETLDRANEEILSANGEDRVNIR